MFGHLILIMFCTLFYYCLLPISDLPRSSIPRFRSQWAVFEGSSKVSSYGDRHLATRGLHGADFQPQIQCTPFSWIQIHSTPNSKINGASIPIHMKVRSVFTCIVLKYKQCLCLMLQIWHIFLNHCCILGIWPCFCVAYVMFYEGSESIVSF